ncbi:hypothetical protein ACFXTI_006688 [Malus domestica]
MSSSSKDDNELAKHATTKGSRTPSNGPNIPVFRYILMSRRKNVLPLTQLGDTKVARLPQGFIKALPKGVEPSFLPT